jgi:hypothetical protein
MELFKKIALLTSTLVLSIFGFSSANAVPISADNLVIVDESGSMSGEHAWLAGTLMPNLETGLLAAGVGTGAQSNRYGLIGYGATNHGPAGQDPHKHSVGGGDWGTAGQFATAAGGLSVSGGTEDGYEAIAYGFANYTFNPGAAKNIILITDEDRDIAGGPSKGAIADLLVRQAALLNVVVNCNMTVGGTSVLGVDSAGQGYAADGSGGFNTVNGALGIGGCSGSTYNDYITLAFGSGGAAWDLNLLRAGGLTATSFSAAFVDIKVEEIVTGVPEPTSLLLMGLGLAGLGFGSRRKAKTA